MNITPTIGTFALDFSSRLDPARGPHARKGVPRHDLSGYGYMRTVMEFMKWAHEQDRFPTIAAVRCRFNVSKATAYRWTNCLADTYGIDPPVRSGEGAR